VTAYCLSNADVHLTR